MRYIWQNVSHPGELPETRPRYHKGSRAINLLDPMTRNKCNLPTTGFSPASCPPKIFYMCVYIYIYIYNSTFHCGNVFISSIPLYRVFIYVWTKVYWRKMKGRWQEDQKKKQIETRSQILFIYQRCLTALC